MIIVDNTSYAETSIYELRNLDSQHQNHRYRSIDKQTPLADLKNKNSRAKIHRIFQDLITTFISPNS